LTSARDQQIRALYRAALERPPAERAAFVAELSGGDLEIVRSVERLLSQQGAATELGSGTSAEASADLQTGATLGHYRIDAVLGRGGMGVVYRATDTKLNRSVAIKFLSIAVADAQAKRRFQQEASTASGLNHPHIVTVHDVGEHDGQQFIVSELVDGGTLEDWSVPNRRKGWRQSVELVTGVADAIAAAHSAGVLHRDIKPGNILIGSNGYAKLADFGLAKLLDRGAGHDLIAKRSPDTHAGVVIGTIAYMSPEQAAGQPLDARSDIFSFGIVLYELLAGRQPFEGANELEQLKSIVHAAPAPLPYGVPELLRMAVDKALEKDPADRYQTMRDLVADLRRVTRKSSTSQSGSRELSDAQVVAAVVGRHRRVVLGVVLLIAGGIYLALSGLAPQSGTPAAGSGTRDYRITQLTRSGDAVSPALSPDGRYVVYSRTVPGGVASGIWVRQVATSTDVPVVPAEPGVIMTMPTVTPDGEFIDFIRGASGGGEPPGIWRVPFLGGTAQRIARNVWSAIGWSPDGRRMAFVRVDVAANTSQLVVADADGRNERVLVTRQAPSYLVSVWIVGAPVAGRRGHRAVLPRAVCAARAVRRCGHGQRDGARYGRRFAAARYRMARPVRARLEPARAVRRAHAAFSYGVSRRHRHTADERPGRLYQRRRRRRPGQPRHYATRDLDVALGRRRRGKRGARRRGRRAVSGSGRDAGLGRRPCFLR
jgi:serine/threonine protein kinase